MNHQSISHRQYEITSEASAKTTTKPSAQPAWISNLWRRLMHTLFNPHEPRVWQERDASGQLWWCAYDPASNRSVYCDTETDLRSWLDQLPY